jgi:hypothetical protein
MVHATIFLVLALGCARSVHLDVQSRLHLTPLWRLQNRNRIAEIAMLKKLVVAGHFEG